jgi:hypothetical protein
METLAWNRVAKLQAQSRLRPSRAAKRDVGLAGFQGVGTAPFEPIVPDACAPPSQRRAIFETAAVHLPGMSALAVTGLAGLVAQTLAATPGPSDTTKIVAVESPASFPKASALMPPSPFAPVLTDLVPRNAGSIAYGMEMAPTPIENTVRVRRSSSIPELNSVLPLGVIDPEELAARRRSPAAVPAVIGERVTCEPGGAVHLAYHRKLRIRRSERRVRGVFVPGLRIGTLRPRMAFGPTPDRRRVISFDSRTSQRSWHPDKPAKVHRA